MRKTFTAIAAAATLAIAAVSVPSDANAQWRRHGGGGAGLAAGIIGGLAAGAIIGSATRGSWGPEYAPAPGYVVYPAYAQGAPVDCPDGYWTRRPVYDRYGEVVGWRGRPHFVCP